MNQKLDLLFEKLTYRPAFHPSLDGSELKKEGCLVATYQCPNISRIVSGKTFELLKDASLDAFHRSSGTHPGRSVSMPDVLPDSVDVWLVPISRRLRRTKLFHLDILGFNNRIVARCSEGDYVRFSSEARNSLFVAGEFRHRLRLSLSQELKFFKPFGVSFSINRIDVSVEPVDLEDFYTASKVLQLASQQNASKIFGVEVSRLEPPLPPSADRTSRINHVISLLDNI